MHSPEDFIKLTQQLHGLFHDRDNSYTLCTVVGDVECDFLRFIFNEGRPMRMSEISSKYQISSTKVTRIIDKLVRKKFIHRYPSNIDRRCWYARITVEGKRMAENTNYKLNEFQKTVLDKIPDDKIDSIYDSLEVFTNAYSATISEAHESPSK